MAHDLKCDMCFFKGSDCGQDHSHLHPPHPDEGGWLPQEVADRMFRDVIAARVRADREGNWDAHDFNPGTRTDTDKARMILNLIEDAMIGMPQVQSKLFPEGLPTVKCSMSPYGGLRQEFEVLGVKVVIRVGD